MGETTGISWTDHSFNPWEGCQRVSPGCEHCYAETRNARFHPDVKGKASHWGPGAERLMRSEAYWREPLKWDKRAKKDGVRRRVFCASLADVFEDRPELVAPRERLFDLIESCDGLDWLLLTKRPENMTRLASRWGDEWPANVWAGTTVEDSRRAEERVAVLMNVPASVRFLSCEPLLEGIDLRSVPANHEGSTGDYLDCLSGCEYYGQDEPLGIAEPEHVARRMPRIDWVIVGGESGSLARRFHIERARLIVANCRAAGSAVFVKQLGSNAYDSGQRMRLRDRAGADPSEWPEDLRVQMFPGEAWT